jgi:hypothetical protein
VALSFPYRLVRRVLEVVRVHWSDIAAKDAEILVPRHQLAVLRHQVARPRFTSYHSALVGLLAGLVPRGRPGLFLVTPQTILGCTARWSASAGPTHTADQVVRPFPKRPWT